MPEIKAAQLNVHKFVIFYMVNLWELWGVQ